MKIAMNITTSLMSLLSGELGGGPHGRLDSFHSFQPHLSTNISRYTLNGWWVLGVRPAPGLGSGKEGRECRI